MIMDIENEGLRRYFNRAFWVYSNFYFIGENPREITWRSTTSPAPRPRSRNERKTCAGQVTKRRIPATAWCAVRRARLIHPLRRSDETGDTGAYRSG